MQKLIRKYLLPCLFFGNLQLMAQVQPLPGAYPSGAPVSYVRTWDATAPEQDANLIISRPLEDVKMTTQYLDGLGRPLQLVVKQGSKVTGAAATDVVSSNVYDAFGREPVKYLPYADAGTNGAFKLNPFNPQVGFYNTQLNGQAGETTVNNTTPNWAYSQTNYEGSLLNRVTESFAPGNSWAGTASQTLEANRRSVKNKYWLNTTLDAVKIFTVTNGSTGSFGAYSAVGNYDANVLFKNITVDERGKQVVEFKDKEGRVILKKVQIGTVQDLGGGTAVTADWLSTYYIYDDLGLLRCVVQPEGVKALTGNGYTFTTPILDEQCFRYLYDERNRMVMKKVPGAGYVGMVYDARDRLVITQDANMRSGAVPRFAYTKYDDLNRPVETGIFEWTATIEGYWGLAYNQTDFPWNHWGPIIPQVLTSTWYDDYNFPWGPFANAAYLTTWNSHLLPASGSWPYPQANSKSNATKGLVTGTRTLILGTGTYIYDATIYDAKGRAIQVQSTNISSNAAAMDVSTMQYNWAGQPLVTVHSNVLTMGGIVPDQTAVVVTQNSYDELGRLTRIEKKQSHTNVNSGAMSSYKTIAEMEYDALGQLKKKKLAPAYNSNTGLEHLAYDYNIRGWMLGMNRWYARDASLPVNTPSGSGYFGFDLGYDKISNNLINSQSYAAAQYNGNISGTVWKSRGDGEKRQYNYSYDNANRLLQADFKQYSGSSFINDPVVNFDVKMGDGSSPTSAYDANGNILQMQHWGLLLNSSAQIDDLRYKYEDMSGVQSNRLKTVVDVFNDPATKLGDFRTATTHPQSGTKNLTNIAAITDYTYDANGNMIRDYNKAIGNSSNDGIVYNHLNLPSVVTVRNAAGNVKGTITYTYTASGQKLQKITEEKNVEVNSGVFSDVTTNTLYMPAGIVYESKLYSNGALSAQQKWGILQFMGHEEGRIRFKPAEGATAASLQYDYMIKDHLGNVRMVLTEEQQQKTYPAATFENATVNGSNARAEEIKYYDIDQSKIVANPAGTATYPNNNGNPPYNTNPYSNTTATTDYMYKTNASTNKTGLGIVLKVMAGDNVNIYGVSYHKKPTGGSYTTPVSSLSVSDIINAFVGTGIMAPKGISGSTITGASGFPTNIASLIGSQPAQTADLPRASINWVILDEQFKHVAGGFDMANGTSGSLKFHTISTIPTIPITKNGYIYVYVSNESNYDVLFDNLQVIHTPGPILEETHYYPFGLTMAGISSKALNGVAENKLKFVSQELDDDFGLNWYQFRFRNHDPQIGRFWQIDPLASDYVYNSTYAYAENRSINGIDLEGLEWMPINKDGDAVKPNDYDNINGYIWAGYDINKETGERTAKSGTVAQAYTFGEKGMITLGVDEKGNATKKWESYSSLSSGDKRADENIASLDPRVQNQMKAVILELRLRYGIDVRGGYQGGFRTYAEQDEIFARGASKARGGQSNHNFAIAMDVAIYENGKYLSKGTEWQYATYGKIAKDKRGLMWGGDWKTFFDPAHIEYKHNLKMKELRALPKDKNGFLIELP